MKQTKILQINSVVKYGSTGKITECLGGIIISERWQSYIAYGRNTKKIESDSEIVKIGGKYDIIDHALKSRIFDRQGFYSKYATQKLIKIIKQEKPDIIHLHNLHGYYIDIEVLFEYIKAQGVNVVWTLHDCWPFTGHCAYFDAVNCEKWKNGCYECPAKHSYPASWLIDNSKKNWLDKRRIFTQIEKENMIIVVPSQWLKMKVEQSFLKNYPIKVIYNGIDLDIFRHYYDENIKKDKPLIFACASIWNKRKGYTDIIKLSEILPEYQFMIVGVSPKQYRDLKKTRIVALQRTENTEQLAKLYSSADVFINPTYEDNFPTVNLEALACGTPVITYNTGGSPEAIDENSGKVVPKGDIHAMAEAIRTVIQSKPQRFSMEQCRSRAMLFDMNDRFQEYIDLYKEILSK